MGAMTAILFLQMQQPPEKRPDRRSISASIVIGLAVTIGGKIASKLIDHFWH